MPSESTLAILLYSEVSNFDRLIKRDEDAAFEMLNRNREIHHEVGRKNNGTILRESGTETLMTFKTVNEAINCALNLQEKWTEFKHKRLRIALHQGELALNDKEPTGDGINVVRGLAASATGGSVYASETVARNIEERPDLTTKYIGEKQLKDVSYPIRTHKLVKSNFPTMTLRSTRRLRYSMIAFIVFVILFSIFSAMRGCEVGISAEGGQAGRGYQPKADQPLAGGNADEGWGMMRGEGRVYQRPIELLNSTLKFSTNSSKLYVKIFKN